jgi:hypothetical protein
MNEIEQDIHPPERVSETLLLEYITDRNLDPISNVSGKFLRIPHKTSHRVAALQQARDKASADVAR